MADPLLSQNEIDGLLAAVKEKAVGEAVDEEGETKSKDERFRETDRISRLLEPAFQQGDVNELEAVFEREVENNPLIDEDKKREMQNQLEAVKKWVSKKKQVEAEIQKAIEENNIELLDKIKENWPELGVFHNEVVQKWVQAHREILLERDQEKLKRQAEGTNRRTHEEYQGPVDADKQLVVHGSEEDFFAKLDNILTIKHLVTKSDEEIDEIVEEWKERLQRKNLEPEQVKKGIKAYKEWHKNILEHLEGIAEWTPKASTKKDWLTDPEQIRARRQCLNFIIITLIPAIKNHDMEKIQEQIAYVNENIHLFDPLGSEVEEQEGEDLEGADDETPGKLRRATRAVVGGIDAASRWNVGTRTVNDLHFPTFSKDARDARKATKQQARAEQVDQEWEKLLNEWKTMPGKATLVNFVTFLQEKKIAYDAFKIAGHDPQMIREICSVMNWDAREYSNVYQPKIDEFFNENARIYREFIAKVNGKTEQKKERKNLKEHLDKLLNGFKRTIEYSQRRYTITEIDQAITRTLEKLAGKKEGLFSRIFHREATRTSMPENKFRKKWRKVYYKWVSLPDLGPGFNLIKRYCNRNEGQKIRVNYLYKNKKIDEREMGLYGTQEQTQREWNSLRNHLTKVVSIRNVISRICKKDRREIAWSVKNLVQEYIDNMTENFEPENNHITQRDLQIRAKLAQLAGIEDNEENGEQQADGDKSAPSNGPTTQVVEGGRGEGPFTEEELKQDFKTLLEQVKEPIESMIQTQDWATSQSKNIDWTKIKNDNFDEKSRLSHILRTQFSEAPTQDIQRHISYLVRNVPIVFQILRRMYKPIKDMGNANTAQKIDQFLHHLENAETNLPDNANELIPSLEAFAQKHSIPF